MKRYLIYIAFLVVAVSAVFPLACSTDVLPESKSIDDSGQAFDEYDDDDDDSAADLGVPGCSEDPLGLAARGLASAERLSLIVLESLVFNSPALDFEGFGLNPAADSGCPTPVTDSTRLNLGVEFSSGCRLGRDDLGGTISIGESPADSAAGAGASADFSSLRFLGRYAAGSLNYSAIGAGEGNLSGSIYLPLSNQFYVGANINFSQGWYFTVTESGREYYFDGSAVIKIGYLDYNATIDSLKVESRCHFPTGGKAIFTDGQLTFSPLSCYSGLVDYAVADGAGGFDVPVTKSLYGQFYGEVGPVCSDGYSTCVANCDGVTECESVCDNSFCSVPTNRTCDQIADECAAACAPYNSACASECNRNWLTCCRDSPDCSCAD